MCDALLHDVADGGSDGRLHADLEGAAADTGAAAAARAALELPLGSHHFLRDKTHPPHNDKIILSVVQRKFLCFDGLVSQMKSVVSLREKLYFEARHQLRFNTLKFLL